MSDDVNPYQSPAEPPVEASPEPSENAEASQGRCPITWMMAFSVGWIYVLAVNLIPLAFVGTIMGLVALLVSATERGTAATIFFVAGAVLGSTITLLVGEIRAIHNQSITAARVSPVRS